MKHPGAYYLVLLYVTVMLKPLMPLISDAWAHTFAESIHIATVHAKYGANHLEKELSATSSENENNKAHNSVKTEEPFPPHLTFTECNDEVSLNAFDISYPVFNLNIPEAVFIFNQAPPPKFCCLVIL
jgi:hypothetical protein